MREKDDAMDWNDLVYHDDVDNGVDEYLDVDIYVDVDVDACDYEAKLS